MPSHRTSEGHSCNASDYPSTTSLQKGEALATDHAALLGRKDDRWLLLDGAISSGAWSSPLLLRAAISSERLADQ